MILKDYMYTIVSRDTVGDGYIFIIRLLSECPVFKAHFPTVPISPGACIIQIATELISLCHASPLALSGARGVKFLHVLSPSDTDEITVSIQQLSDSAEYSVVFKDKRFIYAKLTITCTTTTL